MVGVLITTLIDGHGGAGVWSCLSAAPALLVQCEEKA